MGYPAGFPYMMYPVFFFRCVGESGIKEALLNKRPVYDTAREQVITHIQSFFYL